MNDIAPTAPKVYATYFQEFPEVTEEPYFINFVNLKSKQPGFQVLNLLPLMEPHAADAYLYFRDDPHWNPNGHRVIADLIRKHTFSQ